MIKQEGIGWDKLLQGFYCPEWQDYLSKIFPTKGLRMILVAVTGALIG